MQLLPESGVSVVVSSVLIPLNKLIFGLNVGNCLAATGTPFFELSAQFRTFGPRFFEPSANLPQIR